jgi:hypothetical protein
MYRQSWMNGLNASRQSIWIDVSAAVIQHHTTPHWS